MRSQLCRAPGTRAPCAYAVLFFGAGWRAFDTLAQADTEITGNTTERTANVARVIRFPRPFIDTHNGRTIIPRRGTRQRSFM